ncbi:V-type ATPase 116kDa subunit family protein [Infirmifilum sp. SLHALR2]
MPEAVQRFRIAVPSEYEVNLLDALAAVGSVHLEPTIEARGVLPPLLVDVLEGKITPQTLNVEEALEVARKVLRRDDILLRRVEEKVEGLYNLQKLKRLAERLYEIGVSPEDIGKEKLGLVTDLIFVADENLSDAISSLLALGVIVRRGRVSSFEHALLLIYRRELQSKVEEVKRLYSIKFDLPEWFFDKPETVLRKIEEEEARLRKDLYDLLLEVAGVLRDAVEFERASRLEVIGNAYRAVRELRQKRELLEDMVYTIASLKLALKACKEDALQLSKIGLGKEYCSFVKNILKENVMSQRDLEKALSSLPAKKEASTIMEEIQAFYKYLGVKALLAKALDKLEAGCDALLAAYGEDALQEFCKADACSVYGASILASESIGWGFGCVLAVPTTVSESLASALRARYKALVYTSACSPEKIKEMLQDIERREQSLRNSIVAKTIMTALKHHKVSLEKVAEHLNDADLKELVGLLKAAFSEISPRPLPEEERFTFLRDLISSVDAIGEEIKYLNENLKNILELPYEEMPAKLSAQLVVLKDILIKVREYLSYEQALEVMHRAQPLLSQVRVFRSRRITVVEGYVPAKFSATLREELSRRVSRILYMKFEDVPRRENAPTYVETRGLRGLLYKLTSMRGTPAYWEIDPTLIFTALFTVMYGMMFGDVGQGLLLVLFGLWLIRTKYPLLGIKRESAGTLGALATLAGASSMVFGVLYGFMFFLKQLGTPLISPIHDVYEIISIALWFGVVQLLLAMTLNVVNLVRFGDLVGAVFSGMGGMGILFYASGVMIAYKLASSGFNFAVLSSPDVVVLLWLVVGALIGVLGLSFYEAKFTGHKERLMHAMSEVIEMLIAFPANSLSYIRLAAFAMAHEAFGILAENMAPFAGETVSFLVANFLVLAIEALAVGIQAMRLTYYEFSTKFFKGEGIKFKPIAATAEMVRE